MLSLLHLHHSYQIVTGLISTSTADLPATINSRLQVNKNSPAFDPSKAIINNSSTWSEGKKESEMRASDVEKNHLASAPTEVSFNAALLSNSNSQSTLRLYAIRPLYVMSAQFSWLTTSEENINISDQRIYC